MRSHIPLLFLAVTTTACVDVGNEVGSYALDAELPPAIASLERIDYFAHLPLSECSDAPERLQDELLTLESVLALRGPERVGYFFHEGELGVGDEPCPDGVTGCARGSLIYSREYVHRHELVHAVLANEPRPGALLREGMATAFGHNAVTLPETPPTLSSMLATDQAEPGDVYASGALLVAHLHRRFGREQLLEFYRTSSPDSSEESLAALFQQIFEDDLAEVWKLAHEERAPYVCDELASDAVITSGSKLFSASSCQRAGLAAQHVFTLGGSSSELSPSSQTQGNDSDSGPRGGEGASRVGLAIGSNYYSSTLYTCMPGGPTRTLFGSPDGMDTLYVTSAPAGQYILSRRAVGDLEPAHEYATVQAGSFIGDRCGRSEPLALPPETDVLRIDLAEGEVLGLSWRGSEPVFLQAFEGDLTKARFSICSDCTGKSSCQQFSTDEPVIVQPGTSWISVHPDARGDLLKRFQLGAVRARIVQSN